MPQFDASNAECLVFTYKEGLLSAVAHDLKIRVTDFTVEMNDPSDVTARFDASSLRVVCPVKDGRDAPGLSDNDRKTIEDSIKKDVLHTGKFAEIKFESSASREAGEGYQVRGSLNLHGQEKTVVVDVKPDGDKWVAEATLHQPDFGIKPFSAMMGTLKIKPDVRVRLSIPRS